MNIRRNEQIPKEEKWSASHEWNDNSFSIRLIIPKTYVNIIFKHEIDNELKLIDIDTKCCNWFKDLDVQSKFLF